jgi:hypothetical protein
VTLPTETCPEQAGNYVEICFVRPLPLVSLKDILPVWRLLPCSKPDLVVLNHLINLPDVLFSIIQSAVKQFVSRIGQLFSKHNMSKKIQSVMDSRYCKHSKLRMQGSSFLKQGEPFECLVWRSFSSAE